MVEWWSALSAAGQIFALMAIPATVLLVLQTILLLFGIAGHDAGTDADTSGLDDGTPFDATHMDFHEGTPEAHDGEHHMGEDAQDGLRLFTVRGFIAFFAIFGWTGLALSRSGTGAAVSSFAAFAAGLAAMVVLALIIKYTLKLQASGNMDLRNAVGKSASVYLTIPSSRSGTGKVNVMLQEQLCELTAVTDSETPIRSGVQVTVISVTGDGMLVVTPKLNPL